MKKLLTIVTPTFNRAENLFDLYSSLLKQTSKDFCWLIVDDGSKDDTLDKVKQWIDEGIIDIQYVYRENGGKCRALKTGIDLCDTQWFICVDSDDSLTKNAVKVMLDDISSFSGGKEIGFIYPQKWENKKRADWIPGKVEMVNIMDAKHLYGITETAILFRTEYLKMLDFPFFEEEKFLSEEILYIQLAEYGMFIPRNTSFYFGNYQEDGLTKNLFRIWQKNPQGALCLLQNRYAYCGRYPLFLRIKNRIKCIMNLNAFCMAIGYSWYELTPNKVYSMLLYFPSVLWKKIRFE